MSLRLRYRLPVACAVALFTIEPVFAEVLWADRNALQEMPLDELVDAIRVDPSSLDENYLAAAELALQRTRSEQADDLYALACSGVLRAHYLRGEIQRALTTATDCLDYPGARANNSEFVNLRNGVATLLMLNGRTEEARAAFEAILADDLTGIDPVVIRRMRASYASALKLSGEVVASLAVLSDVLGEAIQHGDVTEQVNFGNNLVVMLEERRLYRDAANWIERLAPAMEQASPDFPLQSLQLHKIQLHGIFQDREQAILQFREYIDERPERPDVLIGSAYEYMAEALYESGDYAAATTAASQAILLLNNSPIELVNARLNLAQAAIASGDLATAEQSLALVRTSDPRDASSIEGLRSLEFELELAKSGDISLAERFKELVASRERRERARRQLYTDFFDAKLRAVTTETELEELGRQQDLLEAQATVDAGRLAAARTARNLTIVSAILALLLFGSLSYLWAQRRFERAFRQEQERLTAGLQSEVKVQSEALVKLARTEALGKLTGNVAHDFNNLLQVTSFANEKIATESISDTARRLLDASSEALSSARGIVSQLLAYARQQKLDEQALGLRRYFDEVRPLLDAALGRSMSLAVTNDVPIGTGITVDKAQFTSALINLLRNAADAMSNSGSVQISITALEYVNEDGAQHWELEDGRYVELVLTDSGCGMSEEQVKRATEPFFSTRNESSGTGLGLSSVYGFVRQSSGDLSIASVEHQGTTVRLRFPAVSVSESPAEVSPRKAATLAGSKVLIVEDNKLVGETLRAMLANADIVSTLVSSGADAIAELESQKNHFDGVLSDICMPGEVDGFALAEWVETHRPDLPIMLMSGFSDEKKHHRPILGKPFSITELLDALTKLLG